MHVYLCHEAKRIPSHVMHITPAADEEFVSNPPVAWLDEQNGQPIAFAIEFKYGKAEVDDQIGEYLVARKLARRTALFGF